MRTAFRKDPADGETIFSTARERIRIFKNGFVDAEEPEDGEREDDSEIDMAEDPEVDDLGTETNNKEIPNLLKSSSNTVVKIREHTDEIVRTDGGHGKMNEGLTSIELTGSSNGLGTPDMEDASIDGSNPGEPWVEGLMEGEYSNLCVEERLNALVSLIGVATEGNSIRVVLEV